MLLFAAVHASSPHSHSKPSFSIFMPLPGSLCKHILSGPIFVPAGTNQTAMELSLFAQIANFFGNSSDSISRPMCMQAGVTIMCTTIFSQCDTHYGYSLPRPLCKGSCQSMAVKCIAFGVEEANMLRNLNFSPAVSGFDIADTIDKVSITALYATPLFPLPLFPPPSLACAYPAALVKFSALSCRKLASQTASVFVLPDMLTNRTI